MKFSNFPPLLSWCPFQAAIVRFAIYVCAILDVPISSTPLKRGFRHCSWFCEAIPGYAVKSDRPTNPQFNMHRTFLTFSFFGLLAAFAAAERDPLLNVLLKPEYGAEAGAARGRMVHGFEKRPMVSCSAMEVWMLLRTNLIPFKRMSRSNVT